ncbi:hypothetical protein FRB95_001343 [Tulasnella sp. JGI-2019a]|nr:hypothetical protein FRB95_001343 [Tulasnella sp. JGI-2019a]
MYLSNAWTKDDIKKVVDGEFSAIPILLMMESAYRLEERFVPVAGEEGVDRLPLDWVLLHFDHFDADDKVAFATTVYGMDLLPHQEDLMGIVGSRQSTLDRLDAFRQLHGESKAKAVSDIINALCFIGGEFMPNQAMELIEVIALLTDPENLLEILE